MTSEMKMINKLKDFAKEIIDLCNLSLNDDTSPNVEVVKIIKREFEAQYNSLRDDGKAIVLNKRKEIWATRTIVDSAQFEYDKTLFDSVYEFAKLLKKLSSKDLIILYN